MAKNIKKKFTISLDIGTSDAEKQLKSAAESIKKTLKGIAQEGNSLQLFNELADKLSQVDDQMSSLKQSYGSDFERLFSQIGASIREEFGSAFDAASVKLKEFQASVADEKSKLDNWQAILTDFNKASKAATQAKNGDKITGFKGTKEEAQELFASFDELIERKKVFESSGDFSSEGYLKNYIKLMKTAAGIINANKLAFDGKNLGISQTALDEKAAQAEEILKNMFKLGLETPGSSSYVYDYINSYVQVTTKSLSDMAEAIAEAMKDSIHTALAGIADSQDQNAISETTERVKKEASEASKYYDIVKTKMEEYYELQRKLASLKQGTSEYKEASTSQFKIQEEVIELKRTSDAEKDSIYDVFDSLYDGNIAVEDAVNNVCAILNIDVPKATQQAESEMESLTSTVEIKVNNVVAGFKQLIEYISSSGHVPGDFFSKLQTGAITLNEEIKNILSSLNLLDENGNVDLKSINSGATNTGGMISDDYVLISREAHKLPFSLATKQKSMDAKAMGANIGAVLEVYEDKANGIIYELQNKVDGTAILDFDNYIVNTEFLNATDEQVKKLIEDLIILQKTGLYVDWNGSNILYDKDKGFSFIDFFADSVEPYTVGKDNSVQENIQLFFDNMLHKFSLGTSESLDVMAFRTNVEGLAATVLKQATAQENMIEASHETKIATDAMASSIDKEELAHEQNAATINEENKALQTQIELKKKAQSMTWEEFALDESLSGNKKDAGLSTIASQERFWKDANYEKDVQFYQIDKQSIEDIFDKSAKFRAVQDDWYGGEEFESKDILENMLLADNELRNAAMNQMWHVYREYAEPFVKVNSIPGVEDKLQHMLSAEWDGDAEKYDKLSNILYDTSKIRHLSLNAHSFDDQHIKSVMDALNDFENSYGEDLGFVKDYIRAATIGFDDFVNGEFVVYRGDESDTPALYGSDQSLSFSFNRGIADWFNGNVASTTISPKNTVGNASMGSLLKEAEVFVPSSHLPYIVNTDQSFDEFFQTLDESTKKTINAALVQQEANRVKNLLGDNIVTAFDDASGWDNFKITTLDAFKKGIVPDTISFANNADLELFADVYNGLTETQKRLVAYYATLDSNSNKMFLSSSSHTKNAKADVLNAVMNDTAGLERHVDKLTGESQFNILARSAQSIESETEHHNKNTQAIKAEQQAQDALNHSKQLFSEVNHKLAESALDSDGTEMSAINSIWNSVGDVYKTEQHQLTGKISADVLGDGFYVDGSTGELLCYEDIFDSIRSFEKDYGENLSYLKDYLKQVFSKYVSSKAGMGFLEEYEPFEPQTAKPDEYDSVTNKLTKLLHATSGDEYDYLEYLYESIEGIKETSQTRPELIKDGKFVDDLDWTHNFTEFYNEIESYENKFGKDLQYVKDYVYDVFSEYMSQFGKAYAEKDDAPIRYTDIQDKLLGIRDDLFDNNQWDQYEALNNIFYSFSSMHNEQDLDNGTFKNIITSETNSMADLLNAISNYEFKYGENLQYVKDHVNKVFEKYNAQIDAFLSGDTNAFAPDSSDIDDELILDGFEETDDIYNNQETIRPVVAEQQLATEQQITAEKRQQAQLDASEEQTGVNVSNIETESTALHNLLLKINDVEQAIKNKTQTFVDEGFTVDQVIQQELLALSKLSVALNDVKLAVGSIGQISIADNIDEQGLQNINIPVIDSELANERTEVDNRYALDQTLLNTNGILERILAAVSSGEQNVQLSDALNGAITELKNVANGIVEHQKAQQTDKSVASAKIASNYGQLSDITSNAVSSLGADVQIKQMTALSDGVVKVEGTVREADGVWKGFIVDIDESNNAVIRAVNEQSKFAQTLNESAEAAKRAAKEASPQDQLSQSLLSQKTAFNDYRKNLQDVDYLNEEVNTKLAELAIRLQGISDIDALAEWKDDFAALRDEITTVQTVFSKLESEKLKNVRGQLNSEFKNLDFTTTTSNPTGEQQEILNLRQQLLQQLEEYKLGIKEGKAVELDSLNATMAALRQKISVYREANNLESGAKQKFGATATLNATAKFNSLKQQASSGEFANSSVVQAALQQYEASYNRLIEKRKELSRVEGELTDTQKSDFKQLQTECNNYAKTLNKIITDSQKLQSNSVSHGLLGEDFDDSVDGRKAALKEFVDSTYGASAKVGEFNDNFNRLVFTVDNGDGTFTEMTASINAARTAIDATAGTTKKAMGVFESFVNELKGKFKSISAYLLSSLSIQEVWQQLRKGVQYVREIDLALTELKKVTDETDAAYDRFLQNMSKTAGVVGSTISELTTMAAEWARLGYSMEEAGKLAESTAILLNVSEFEDATKASEALISTMQAFQYTADESQHVVDILNEVGELIARR